MLRAASCETPRPPHHTQKSPAFFSSTATSISVPTRRSSHIPSVWSLIIAAARWNSLAWPASSGAVENMPPMKTLVLSVASVQLSTLATSRPSGHGLKQSPRSWAETGAHRVLPVASAATTTWRLRSTMACSQRVRKQPLPPPRGCSRAAFSLQRRTTGGLRRPPGTAALVPSVTSVCSARFCGACGAIIAHA